MMEMIGKLKGWKSYLVVGFAVASWVAGETGLASAGQVESVLTLCAALFGATLAAKINRIRSELSS